MPKVTGKGFEVIGVKLDIEAELGLRVNEHGTRLLLAVPPNCKTVKEFKAYLVSELFGEKQKIKFFVGNSLYEVPDFTSVSVFLTHNDSAIRVAPEREQDGFRRIPKSSILTAIERKLAVRFGQDQDIGSQYSSTTNLSPLNGAISINDNSSSIAPEDSASVVPDDDKYETENSDGEDASENKRQTRSTNRQARVRRGVGTKAKTKAMVTKAAASTSLDEKENKTKKYQSKTKKNPKTKMTKMIDKLKAPRIVVAGATEVTQPSAQERPELPEVISSYPTFPSSQGSDYNDQIDPVSRKRHFASDTDSSNPSEEECVRTASHRGPPKVPKFLTNPEGLKRYMELHSQQSPGTKFDSPQLTRYMEPFGIASQVVFNTIAEAQEGVKKRLEELDFGQERDKAQEKMNSIQKDRQKSVKD